jgi:hypothetical protein
VNVAPPASLDDWVASLSGPDSGQDVPRTAAIARQQAEAIWFATDPPAPHDAFRRIERQAKSVDYFNAQDLEGEHQQLVANSPLASEALAKLSPAEQASYQRVADGIGPEPGGRLALQLLLIEGKLTDPRVKATDGKNLLDALAGLADQPIAKGLGKSRLLDETVREIAEPSAIKQEARGTCTVTVVQNLLAKQNPAEYARLVSGLASPDGKVALVNGDTLHRVAGTVKEDGSWRTQSSRLFEAAMMDYAQPGYHYNNAKDATEDGISGLYDAELKTAMEGVLGRPVASREVDMLPAIAKETAAGRPVAVGMHWDQTGPNGVEHGGHEILVTKVDAERVYYDNPWGIQESMTRQEFESRAKGALLTGSPVRAGGGGGPEDPDLARNRSVVVSNVSSIMGSYQNLLAKLGPHPKGPDHQVAESARMRLLLLQEVRDRLLGTTMPAIPTPQQKESLLDAMNAINQAAISMDGWKVGNEAAQKFAQPLHALEQATQ